jgi:probable F420-dependent oxidoreductase
MKFALHFGNLTFPSPKDAKNLALTATTVRFESIIAVEHVVIPSTYKTKYPYNETGRLPGDMEMAWPDPLAWLTFIGGVTTKLRLITGVLVLPQRNPLILAKHLATIDYLTGGRFELGVGVGWLREEFDALGVPFDRRGARMDEYIKLMRTLWDGNDASFSGEFSSFHKMNCNPKPFNGRVPIIIGGHSSLAAKRAAHLGDGFFPATGTQTEIKPVIQIMHKEASKIGRNPMEIEITTGCPEVLPGSKIDPLLAIEEKISFGVSRVALPASAFAGNIEEELIVFGEKIIKSFNE